MLLIKVFERRGELFQIGIEQWVDILQQLHLVAADSEQDVHHVVLLTHEGLHLLTALFLLMPQALKEKQFLVVIDFIERALGDVETVGYVVHSHRLDASHGKGMHGGIEDARLEQLPIG